MDYAFAFSGGSPVIKKYQAGESMSVAGVPVVVGGAGNDGIVRSATTTASDLVGITTSTVTVVTAQQTDNATTVREVSVITNPDAVYRAKLSGGATAGTDLSSYSITTASTDGLSVLSTGLDFTSPEVADGIVYFLTGANADTYRKITGTAANDATVITAFSNDIAVGDTFTVVPFTPGENQFVQLTSDFSEIDASVAVDTDNNNFRVVDLQLDGVANSYALIVPFDHLFAAGGSI